MLTIFFGLRRTTFPCSLCTGTNACPRSPTLWSVVYFLLIGLSVLFNLVGSVFSLSAFAEDERVSLTFVSPGAFAAGLACGPTAGLVAYFAPSGMVTVQSAWQLASGFDVLGGLVHFVVILIAASGTGLNLYAVAANPKTTLCVGL